MIRITDPKKFTVILIIVLLLLGTGIFRLVWGNGRIQKTGDITIEQGESAAEIWRSLVEDEYSDRTIAWKYYGRLGHAAEKVQAGTYHLEKGERIGDVVTRFTKGDVRTNELTVTFPEGFTLAQIAARYADRTGKDAKDFLAEAKVKNYAGQFDFLAGLSQERSLEGYLFPDTYKIGKDDTPKDVIVRMLGNFGAKVPQDLRDEAKAQGRTLDDLVNMASIVEKEVQHPEDMAMVAGVLWKRIDSGEGLYVDATLEYIVDKDGQLTVNDLALDSPYNTRKYRGLPPTPISNPGLNALIASLRPKKSDYYYYLTAKDGTTIFAKTNDEHNRNKVKYL